MATSPNVSTVGNSDSDFGNLGKDFDLSDLPDFNMLAGDIDLSGLPDIDLSTGDLDLFGEPFTLSPPRTESVDSEVDNPATPANTSSVEKLSDIDPPTVTPSVLELSPIAKPPASLQTHVPEQITSPQPPKGVLPSGRAFVPVPRHVMQSLRRCSPPRNTFCPPSSLRPQGRFRPMAPGYSQKAPNPSPGTPMVRYSSMGPPPAGRLTLRGQAPVAPMFASPSGSPSPIPSRKRKADATEMSTANSCSSIGDVKAASASDETGNESLAKRQKLEQPEHEQELEIQLMEACQNLIPGSKEAQAMDVRLKAKESEAFKQAMEYRRLRVGALDQAAEYKKLGATSIERYQRLRENRRELKGQV